MMSNNKGINKHNNNSFFLHYHASSIFCIIASLVGVGVVVRGALIESERVEEFHRRGYTWPPKIKPPTPGWEKLMTRRLRQLEFVDVEPVQSGHVRYDGYMNAVASAFVQPSFTENGWGLTRAPQELVDELKKALHDGLNNNPRHENEINVINTPLPSYFVDIPQLTKKVLKVLKPMHEEWSGVELIGNNAYGLRAYRNESALWMHCDKPRTHIISSILHVDHDDDPESEGWPIIIEDFQGNTNEVYLESGDMLFYESSKCLHGRPRPFKGQWYSSIFTHYYPIDWDNAKREKDTHYGVPPGWSKPVPPPEEKDVDTLEVIGTSIREPDCVDNWCALNDTVKWYGPAKYGEVITTGGVKSQLNCVKDMPYEYNDDDDQEAEEL